MTNLVIISIIIIFSYLPNHLIFQWRRHGYHPRPHPCRLLIYCHCLGMVILISSIFRGRCCAIQLFLSSTQWQHWWWWQWKRRWYSVTAYWIMIAPQLQRFSWETQTQQCPRKFFYQPSMDTNKVVQYCSMRQDLGQLMSEK